MKSILIVILSMLCLTLTCKAQSQEGETCLFTCMNHIDPRKTVQQYINDFNEFTATNQDEYKSGARCTIQQFIQFLALEFDTVSLHGATSAIQAMDNKYSLISVINLPHINSQHAIVIQGYLTDSIAKSKITKLVYYDPTNGAKNLQVNLDKFLIKWQIYTVAVRKKANIADSCPARP